MSLMLRYSHPTTPTPVILIAVILFFSFSFFFAIPFLASFHTKSPAIIQPSSPLLFGEHNSSSMDLAHPAQRGTASSSQETGDIVVPVVPRAYEARKNWIIHERQQSVQPYAIASKKAGRIPNRNPSIDEFLERTDRLLAFLEHDFEISPKYKTEAQLEALFKVILDRTRFHFPQNLKDRARALYEEWEATNWGAADAIESEDGGDDEPQSPTSPTLHSSSLDGGNDRQSVALASIRLPPSDHPIWGVGGIMHGVVPKIGKIKTMQLDRRYLSEKRSAKVFGHNGLQPGDWFASQLVALFHGAHGARIGGIHGTVTDGAYSVVVSGQYKDVDEE